MKKFIWIIIAGITGAVFIIFLILFFSAQNFSTTLEVSVIDAVSKSWVYNTTIRLQNRVIRGFKSTSYTFKNIKTGSYMLSVSAPYYESRETQVTIHAGKNKAKKPIELKGYEIPDLDSISIFEKKKDDEILIDIRLVGNDGHAITDHPCLPLRVLTRISAQLVEGEYGKHKAGMNLSMGKILFSGEAKWKWNTGLTETYRYSAYIPIGDISPSPAPYWIVVYLIIIPDPLRITEEEVEEIVQEIYTIDDPENLNNFLSRLPDTIDYYLTIKPNIENLFGGAR